MAAWVRSQRPDSSKSKDPIGTLAAMQHPVAGAVISAKSHFGTILVSAVCRESGGGCHASPLGAEVFGDARKLKF